MSPTNTAQSINIYYFRAGEINLPNYFVSISQHQIHSAKGNKHKIKEVKMAHNRDDVLRLEIVLIDTFLFTGTEYIFVKQCDYVCCVGIIYYVVTYVVDIQYSGTFSATSSMYIATND